MTRLRLLERNDAAWQDEDYALVMDGLAVEFELEERLEQLQFKLNLVQHDVRFFLTVLHNRKSEFLESCLVGEVIVAARLLGFAAACSSGTSDKSALTPGHVDIPSGRSPGLLLVEIIVMVIDIVR